MKINKLILLFAAVLGCFLANSQENLITNIQARESYSLNGVWKHLVDPYELGFYDYRRQQRDLSENPGGSEAFFLNYKPKNESDRVEYDFDLSENILVPRDWNSQKEKLFYYEGTVWYYKKFNYTPKNEQSRKFVYFGAANYEAHVYLNGKKLGKHVGGFTPFNFEVTGKLKTGENFIIVKVDNTRGLEKVPTVNTDWWNYGGLTRDAQIVEVAQTFIRDYYIQLNRENSELLDVKIYLDGSEKVGKSIEISIPDAQIKQSFTANNEGIAEGTIRVKKLKLWSPETPVLYNVQLSLLNEVLSDKIGFRSLKVNGSDILVNGKSVFLRGICIHEENPIRGGRAYSVEDARMLLGWAKELGCNFVRLAHYPHNENMTRVADELGLMVWSEVPVYWTIQWKNEETYKNAQQQVIDMITRDKNRASIIIWSMANETPISDERTEFLKNLITVTRNLDPVRLVSAALERHTKSGTRHTQVIEDPLQDFVDVIAFNQYIGWYDGTPDQCQLKDFDIPYKKPVMVSEFGGGARQGLHGTKAQIWTEEYQEYLYEETFKMLEKIPQFRGVTPWILADFRSPRRFLPNIQDGWNRKGVISEVGEKKKAYYVVQKYYKEKELQFKGK